VTDDGLHLIVTGPIACDASERVTVRVTVTQRDTGAVAEGRTLLRCTGQTQQWQVHASVQGENAFAPGAATAVAVGRTSAHGAVTDAHQWLVDIALVEE
jgi:hypothetical protein